MPVVDQVAPDYEGRVRFLSVAWKASEEATRARAEDLLRSGQVSWGLDGSGEFFQAWGVPYQPETVLITGDDVIVQRWPGAVGEDQIRARLDALIEASNGGG